MIRSLLAHVAVTNLENAKEWYTRLFDRPPDARPMSGLLEWHLAGTFGVQVWFEPDRAGRSTIVLEHSDLDGEATRLNAAGLSKDTPQLASSSRILTLNDPDGNRVVLTGA